MLGVELEVLARKVDRFGWDRDLGSPVHDRLILDWMDALQDYPLPEVQKAISVCLDEKPGKMPNERDVLAKILLDRERFLLVNRRQAIAQPDPDRKPCTPEAAADIMAEFGFAPKRMP